MYALCYNKIIKDTLERVGVGKQSLLLIFLRAPYVNTACIDLRKKGGYTYSIMNIESIKAKTAPAIESLGYELVDVEIAKRLGDTHLSFFIANEEGITFDDCEKVHHTIDPLLDELNPSGDAPYVLNVSSPGLDRSFKTQRDFERNYNKKVEVKLYAPFKGKKIYEGTLLERKEHVFIIETFKGERVQFENAKVAYVRPYVSFEGLESDSD